MGVGTINASTFSHFVALSKGSGSDLERSSTTEDEVMRSNYIFPQQLTMWKDIHYLLL
jgi:hypothetical protein